MSRRTVSPQRHQHPTLRASSAQGARSHSQNRASLSNRLSAIAGSLASRHSKQSIVQEPELEAHNPNDSAEDLRKVIEQQERDADRLENVRACCDGESNFDNAKQDLVVLLSFFLSSLVQVQPLSCHCLDLHLGSTCANQQYRQTRRRVSVENVEA